MVVVVVATAVVVVVVVVSFRVVCILSLVTEYFHIVMDFSSDHKYCVSVEFIQLILSRCCIK